MGKHASDLTFDIRRHRACRSCLPSYSISVSSLKFVGLPSEDKDTFYGSATVGLVTLTFDLSTSKWGHGRSVTPFRGCQGFLPVNFKLPMPFYSRHETDRETDGQTHRQTDKQTTVINPYFPNL